MFNLNPVSIPGQLSLILKTQISGLFHLSFFKATHQKNPFGCNQNPSLASNYCSYNKPFINK